MTTQAHATQAHATQTHTTQVYAATPVTAESFGAAVLKSDRPVLVDFWAPWCGPCRLVGPLVDGIAQDYSDRLKVVKVNVDQHPELATEYGIRSIPTLLVFREGRKVDSLVGAVPRATLVAPLERHLTPA